MKAKPVKLVTREDEHGKHSSYVLCAVNEATHVELSMPIEFKQLSRRTIPIILSGSRDKANAWTWNGDVDKPTLRPSILTRFTWGEERTAHRCHSFVNDGKVQFLNDCSHENVGKTLDLLEVGE